MAESACKFDDIQFSCFSPCHNDGTDAALKAPSACMSSAWRVATSIVAVSTRVFILSESLVA